MWISRQEVNVKIVQRLATAEALMYSEVRVVASVLLIVKRRGNGQKAAPEKALKE